MKRNLSLKKDNLHTMNTKDETVSTVLSTQASLSTQNSDNCVDSEKQESVESVLKPLGAKSRNTRGGRPKKSEIDKRIRRDTTKGRGRPPGEAQKIKELMARMLLTNGDSVLKKTIDIALNDDHQHQMAAIKLLMDRALPVSFFENKDSNGGTGSGIVINISGLSTPKIESSSDVIDIEAEDVNG